jgi:hypothetical protein
VRYSIALAALLAPVFVFAQSSSLKINAPSQSEASVEQTSTLKLDDARKPTEKDEAIDAEITDPRLRAQLGSLSKWSLKSHFMYAGGAISDPFNGVRPNYRLSARMEEMTTLSGSIGVNYRASVRDNISAGTGITMIDPMHGDLTKNAEDTRSNRSGEKSRYEVSNPYLSWNRGYALADMQMISGVMFSQATSRDAAELMKTSNFGGLTHMVIKPLGSSGWSTGLNAMLIKINYSGEVEDPMLKMMVAAGRIKRPDMIAGFMPSLDYQFNDRYSFRTIFGYFQFTRNEHEEGFGQQEPFQSIGTGISITRDIYLYPNIEFTPKDIRTDRTNVALMTNINLF